MADWPRWILDSTVDSSAMLYAYTKWADAQPGHVEPLCVIEHRMPETVEIAGFQIMPKKATTKGTFERPCTDLGCERCRTGRGGYQFRWYSAMWYDEYVRNARVGAWTLLGAKAPPGCMEL